MEPKKSGFETLMDTLKEDALIQVMVDALQSIHDCCDDAKSDAVRLEMALRRLLKRVDQIAPSNFA